MNDADMEPELLSDADLHSALARVNYAPGMLLGLEATRDEQDYHRRRLNRHRYWLHGAGTVCGLAVSLESREPPDSESDITVHLLVGPGVGIDGLGREVLAHEPHCLNLSDWLSSRMADGGSALRDGLSSDHRQLSLLVSMRQYSLDSGLQPVMARKINAGTDPVEASRRKDCVLFELSAAPLPESPDRYWPWGAQRPQAFDADNDLTDSERQWLSALPEEQRAQARLQAALTYALPTRNDALHAADDDPQRIARTLLAQLTIDLRPDLSPIVNPAHLHLNNLVRPYIASAGQQAWLQAHNGGES